MSALLCLAIFISMLCASLLLLQFNWSILGILVKLSWLAEALPSLAVPLDVSFHVAFVA